MKSEQEWEIELQAILEKLRDNSINEIDLRNRQLDDNGAKVIAKALKGNQSLTGINLDHNDIGAEGAKGLAEALKENRSLTRMFLDENKIGDEGAEALAKALKTNHSLTTMYLHSNNINAKGVTALAEALKENHSLREISLSLNNIGVEGAVALFEALKENHSLTMMDLLQTDNISVEEAKGLAEALKENHVLREMNLSWDRIGKGAFAFLAEAFKVNHSLTAINLDLYSIDAEQKKIIKDYINRNIVLRDQLHQVVRRGDLAKTQEYIQLGVGLVSITGEEKNTPLHWAAVGGHADIVELLLAKMAEQKLNLAIKNKYNQTPLDLAEKKGHKEIIQLLRKVIVKQEIVRMRNRIFGEEKNITEPEKVSVGNIPSPINVQTIQVTNISKDISSSETERYIQRGEKFLSDEEYPEALQYFEEALKLQPEHAEGLFRKGIVLQKLTRLDEAKQIFEKVIAIEDKSAEKYQELAKQHLQKIERKQALLQQATVTPTTQIANTNTLISNDTEREGLLERASSKNVLQKRNIQLGLAAKQTAISHVPSSYSLSQSRDRIQFTPTTRQQTDVLKQPKQDLMAEASEDITKKEIITKRN